MQNRSSQKSSRHAIDWMNHNRFGMFIHWGLYALLERGEWVMRTEERSREEYEKLADVFLGEKFDADAMAKLAKRTGMTHMCMTAKHHDGFCLFDSKLTDYCTPKQAARLAMDEVTGPVVAVALVLAAGFVPCAEAGIKQILRCASLLF